ncbi:hypothetical protein GGU10DRAFT_125449 [Lentinula aff. detonsa]|uniref:GATA-type domain-containing protein n=1 Tax=Lentinula aff. detonsa TaxID=2804958 RepID=A0AA38L0E4_9AGAR|nr:hypothetical protein GGU10DRAFT_125449 [Lentinula aff. detonsa]
MDYRQNTPDKRSISSLLNPVVTSHSDTPPLNSSFTNITRRGHYDQLTSTPCAHSDRHSSDPNPVISSLPPQSIGRSRTAKDNRSRTFNPNLITDSTRVSGITAQRYPLDYTGGQFPDCESYMNGVSTSTAYVSNVTGLPFGNQRHTGPKQSMNPMSQVPVNPSYIPAADSVTQNPGGTFHTFSLKLQNEYSPIRTSPLAVRPRTTRASPQPRICSSCGVTHTILWRKSKVHPGNYLCNRCGLWERNNRVERVTLAEDRASTVKEFIVQSPYSSEGDILRE